MDLINGIVLILSLLILLFLGPEWMGRFSNKSKYFKRSISIARARRRFWVTFPRLTTRIESSQTKS